MNASTSTSSAAALALDVATKLFDAECVTAAVTRQGAATLCDGLAGTALLHACLTHTDSAFEAAAHRHWEAAARLMGNAPPDGIHTGPGALAASLIIGSGYLSDGNRLRDAVNNATAWLSARAAGLARHQQQRAEAGQPVVPWAVYDTIKGLTGIGRVLLAARTTARPAAEPGLTAALTTLTAMIRTRYGTLPGWWLPADAHPQLVRAHPSGAAATGIAHGIAGPLALLALAHSAGFTVPGQAEAIHLAAHWLLTWQDSSVSWPPFVSGDDLRAQPCPEGTSRQPGRRDAWCYGTPGIGRVLQLAGDALADPQLSATANTAIAALAHRDPERWDIEGPTLCHGSAGILQAVNRCGSDALAQQAVARTITLHDPRRPFGFPRIKGGVPLDEPGFLTGAAGVALALADYSGQLPAVASSWDCLLMLS